MTDNDVTDWRTKADSLGSTIHENVSIALTDGEDTDEEQKAAAQLALESIRELHAILSAQSVPVEPLVNLPPDTQIGDYSSSLMTLDLDCDARSVQKLTSKENPDYRALRRILAGVYRNAQMVLLDLQQSANDRVLV